MLRSEDALTGQRSRRNSLVRSVLFWASLLLAIATVVAGYRYQNAPAGACATALEQDTGNGAWESVALPQRMGWGVKGSGVLRYRFACSVNGADLTPGIDLAARNVRSLDYLDCNLHKGLG